MQHSERHGSSHQVVSVLTVNHDDTSSNLTALVCPIFR